MRGRYKKSVVAETTLPAAAQSVPEAPVAEPPPSFTPEERAVWQAVWQAPVARYWTVGDVPLVIEFCRLWTRLENLAQSYRNPAFAPYRGALTSALRLETLWREQLVQLSDRLGLNPLARARLGLTVSQAAFSLHELNRLLDEDD